MNREQILKEIGNWEDEGFLDKTRQELNRYSQEIDSVLYKRYMSQISEQSDEKLKAKALKRLMKRNLIDENEELVDRSDDVIFDPNVPAINGAHDSGRDKIVFNPEGAKSFYESYLQFSEGKREGIRDLDYSLSMEELPDLTPSEILYWNYTHDVSYEDFCKVTLLHENVHKWTLRGATGLGAMMMGKDEIAMIEGLVEQEARAVAKDNPQLTYSNCFRNDEVDIVSFLGKYYSPNNSLLYQSGEKFETNAIVEFLKEQGVPDDRLHEEFNKIIEDFTSVCHQKFSGAPNNEFEKSFYDIFLSKEKLVSKDILAIFEEYQKQSEKAHTVTPQEIAQEDKDNGLTTTDIQDASKVMDKCQEKINDNRQQIE